MLENITKVRVRYAETDAMKVAYHANYIVWFEVGRGELMRSIGYPYARLEADGIMLPLVECGCTYKTPAVYDDVLWVKAVLSHLKGATITIEYEIRKEATGELCAKGMSKHAITDTNLKPIRLRDTNKEFYEHLRK